MVTREEEEEEEDEEENGDDHHDDDDDDDNKLDPNTPAKAPRKHTHKCRGGLLN